MSRGDKTAIELFLAGIRGWEAGLRRVFSGKPAATTIANPGAYLLSWLRRVFSGKPAATRNRNPLPWQR
jgi:hypothetical protein